jgi:hypothetical protein
MHCSLLPLGCFGVGPVFTVTVGLHVGCVDAVVRVERGKRECAHGAQTWGWCRCRRGHVVVVTWIRTRSGHATEFYRWRILLEEEHEV